MATNFYKMELWLSTDGKHTVKVDILDNEHFTEALKDAATLYDKIVEKYGTKAVKSFSKTTTPPKPGGTCLTHHVPMKLNKNGKPYHMNEMKEFCNGHGFPSERESQTDPFENIPEEGWQ